MRANELRIGNWVNDFAGEPHQVIRLSKDKIVLETPIPLAEEWLLKFGFEKMKCITFEWKTEWIIQPRGYGWEIGVLLGDYPETNPNCGCVSILHSKDKQIPGVPPDLYDKENWTKEDIKRANNYTVTFEKFRKPIAYYIKYVHQLQNLYFALTGEELIIKNHAEQTNIQ